MTSNWVERPRPDDDYGRRWPQGILVGVGSLAVIVAGFVASAVPSTPAAARYSVLAVTVLVFTAAADVWAAAIAVSVIGYLVFNGFLVNRLGELSWHGPADGNRLVALAGAVIFGRLIGDGYRSYVSYVKFRRAGPRRGPTLPPAGVSHEVERDAP